MTWLVGISYQDTQGSLVQTDIHTQGHESKIMVHDDPEGELATEIAYFLNNKLSSQTMLPDRGAIEKACNWLRESVGELVNSETNYNTYEGTSHSLEEYYDLIKAVEYLESLL